MSQHALMYVGANDRRKKCRGNGRVSPEEITTVRQVVREELRMAKAEGALLTDDERVLVREWIEARKTRKRLLAGMAHSIVGWFIIAFLGGIGIAVWEFVKRKLGNGNG